MKRRCFCRQPQVTLPNSNGLSCRARSCNYICLQTASHLQVTYKTPSANGARFPLPLSFEVPGRLGEGMSTACFFLDVAQIMFDMMPDHPCRNKISKLEEFHLGIRNL